MTSSCFHRALFTLVLIFLSSAAYMQVQVPSHFRDIFERETRSGTPQSRFGGFQNISTLSYFPDTLPSWFLYPPPASSSKIYAIGISDPDMEPGEAFEQAIYRAKCLAVLFNKAKVQYYRDIFSTENQQYARGQHRQRFDTFFRLSVSQAVDSSDFAVVSEHFTRFHEAIVLLSYTPSSHEPAKGREQKIQAEATVLYVEAHVGNVYEPQAAYDFKTKVKSYGMSPLSAEYNCVQKGSRVLSQSFYNNREMVFPGFLYRYASVFWEPHTRPIVSYNGLWSAYIQRLFKHLTLTTEQSSIRIRSLGETSAPGASDLAREVAVKNARIHVKGVELTPDQINFEVEMIEIP